MPTTDAIIIADVHDRPGVLARLASMFYRRGLNIRTLGVVPTSRPEISRVTVRLCGPERELTRLVPAIGNLVDVLEVTLLDAAGVAAGAAPPGGPDQEALAAPERSGPMALSTCASPSAHEAPSAQRRHSDHSDARSKGAA